MTSSVGAGWRWPSLETEKRDPEGRLGARGRGMSDWVAPPEVTPWRGVPRTEVEAMRRIVALADEPIEMARRFRHLVYAAIEQFNEGNLGRAVPMFELAMSLYEERKIDDGFVETVRRKGHESLDPKRQKQYLGTPNAWRALLDHAFTREASWGVTMSRLTELAEQDLSSRGRAAAGERARSRRRLPPGLGKPPVLVPGETDHSLVASIWEKACAGIPARRLEADLPADAFRIRRVLAHWVEDGVLRVVSPGATPPATDT